MVTVSAAELDKPHSPLDQTNRDVTQRGAGGADELIPGTPRLKKKKKVHVPKIAEDRVGYFHTLQQ